MSATRAVALALLLAAPLHLGAQAPRPEQKQNVATRGAGQQRPATHDDLQPASLKPLPAGMSVSDLVQGDSIYHGKGTCYVCHGLEGEGLPAAGDALTVALSYAQYDWVSIDSLIDHGIPQVMTRSPIQMPPRGGRSDLSDDEVRRVAAYIWAISQTRGEPWPGGHTTHYSAASAVDVVPSTTIRTRADSTNVRGAAGGSASPDPSRGARAIREYGCGSCHSIPGIRGAAGRVGPPLDHWSRRVYIAGRVPNTLEYLVRWIEVPQAIEPGTAMPNLRVPEGTARDIAAYLQRLR